MLPPAVALCGPHSAASSLPSEGNPRCTVGLGGIQSLVHRPHLAPSRGPTAPPGTASAVDIFRQPRVADPVNNPQPRPFSAARPAPIKSRRRNISPALAESPFFFPTAPNQTKPRAQHAEERERKGVWCGVVWAATDRPDSHV